MKKFLTNYYAIIMTLLFIIYNVVLRKLITFGMLYQVFMVILIIFNAIILIRYKKSIKYKPLAIVLFFITLSFSKSVLQCIFNLSNIFILIATGFLESKSIKIIVILIPIYLVITWFRFLVLLSAFILACNNGLNDIIPNEPIQKDTHYYFENNNEIYCYSHGATDSFHYAIRKHYEIINVNDIIYMFYNGTAKEISKEEYEYYLNNYNCILINEEN